MDLYEVKGWPIDKKLVYQEHIADEAIREQKAHDDAMDNDGQQGGGMPSMPNSPTSRMPTGGGGGMPSPGQGQSPSVGTTAPSGREVHPHLQQYSNIVYVGDDDGEEAEAS